MQEEGEQKKRTFKRTGAELIYYFEKRRQCEWPASIDKKNMSRKFYDDKR